MLKLIDKAIFKKIYTKKIIITIIDLIIMNEITTTKKIYCDLSESILST